MVDAEFHQEGRRLVFDVAGIPELFDMGEWESLPKDMNMNTTNMSTNMNINMNTTNMNTTTMYTCM